MKKSLLFLLLIGIFLSNSLVMRSYAVNGAGNEIKEATILNAYWVGDYQVPEISPRKKNSFLLEIQFPIDSPGFEQIQKFIVNAGYQFELKAKSEKAMTAYGYEYNYYQVNNQNIWGFWLFIDSKESIGIQKNIPYRLTLKKPNKNYRWIIKDKIIFQNLSEVKFSTFKDPATEMLTNGRPIGSKDAEVIPFHDDDGFIIINGRINNSEKQYRFIVDTGAGVVVISDKVAAELQLEKKMFGRVSDYYATKAVDIVPLNRLTVGEMGVENFGAMVMNIEILNEYQVDGLIGYDFLKFFNIEIDYEHHLLTLSRENIPADPTAFKTKLYLKPTRQIATELKIGTVRVDTIIDTGSTGKYYLTIPLSFLNEHKSILSGKPVEIRGTAIASAVSDSTGIITRINSVQLGDFHAENLPAILDNGNSIVLGSQFLSHFKVVINFPVMEMSLMPNTGMVMNTNVFSYGFGVLGKDEAGRIYICAIFEGSPAERAGLEVGDEIKKIYSNSNMELTYKDLLNLIKSEENQTIKLLISGQTGEREVVLNKAMLLPEVD